MYVQRPGAVFFNVGFIDQVFCPKNPEKNLAQICLVVFEKNAKTTRRSAPNFLQGLG